MADVSAVFCFFTLGALHDGGLLVEMILEKQ